MPVDMIMPKLGESIAEATVLQWLKKEGDEVERDEIILEISTDKVDSEIPAPAAGVLKKILVGEGETVEVGTVIAEIEAAGAAEGEAPEITEAPAEEAPAPHEAPTDEAAPPPVTLRKRAKRDGHFYSPVVRRMAEKEGISLDELDAIEGSGGGGRVSKKDFVAYLETRKAGAPVGEAAPDVIPADDERTTRVPMPHMRKMIAEHMLKSVRTSAHVSSVSEADVTAIVAYREKHKERFQSDAGIKLTYTPFIVEAAARALKEFPYVNASVDGEEIVLKNYVNIGVAVALEDGLIVPVVRDVDKKDLRTLAGEIDDLSTRARNKKLLPEEAQDGTFSITNMGVFGNLFGIPIISQPQVAILGVGSIQKRPVVDEDAVTIRSMVYLSLSFDHRLIDGAMGGQFLQRVCEFLTDFDSNREL